MGIELKFINHSIPLTLDQTSVANW